MSGIRGTVFDVLTPDVACRYASAFASACGRGTYVVGRDTRPSGALLRDAVVSGIRATGSDVTDVGVATTPTIQVAVEHAAAAGGIAITASHNPSEWNALKLISEGGTFLEKRDLDRVVEGFTSGAIGYAASDQSGGVERDEEASSRHVELVLGLGLLDRGRVSKRRFRVAIDCTNGAASVIIPDLLEGLGCEVAKIDCVPDGNFRRNPEPAEDAIGDLSAAVRQSASDVGFAFDPDGDRLAVVDETGRPVGEEYTLVICADTVLRKARGPLVANLSTTRAVEDVARVHGVEVHRTPIGEANVVALMRRVASPIGGEGNGGVILPAAHYGRDAVVGTALVLEALAESGESLSRMMKRFPEYGIVKRKMSFDSILDFDAIRPRLERRFAGAKFNFDDGIRVDMESGWVHVRRSGTEPVVRVVGEARDRPGALELVEGVIGLIRQAGGS